MFEKQNDCSDWCVAVVGMNATGKSNFGKRLSSKLGLKRCDIDTAFKKRYGSIQSYIETSGPEAYRAQEEELVLEALQPGNLVVLSGGAIESARVREALKDRAAVIWLKASKKRVARNLREAKKERHEFAGNASKEAVGELLSKRQPLYEEVANITLHEHVRYPRQLPVALAELRKFYS